MQYASTFFGGVTCIATDWHLTKFRNPAQPWFPRFHPKEFPARTAVLSLLRRWGYIARRDIAALSGPVALKG